MNFFKSLMNWMQAQRMLPNISDTEREALEAGTVWIDGDLFRGRIDYPALLNEPYSKLSDEEQAFVEGPVQQLLEMINPHEIQRTRKIPDDVLQFIKDQGFMGMLIPREFGGKDFSSLAISTILAKIGPVSATVGTFVVIPNSLGAAELIIHYGTEAQKRHYLPKLAAGELIPCFGLTEPTAGSDAASIKAEGLVFKDDQGEIKLRLNFRKRYITLAPVADLATIALNLHDPENLLGKGEFPGITCVMVERGTPGFANGDHHEPIGDPFYNGPLLGEDVVVPADNIIGGADYAGKGWMMLMQQLAGGRAISLPAGAVGAAKAVMVSAGAYSMVRQQFGLQIGRMAGVEEKLGRIAGLTYMMEASRIFACSAIDNGQQPPVVSAVLKAYTTELSQQLTIDGMDIMAGSAVMQGPNNILGMAYKSAPVGVTVEGANILTRTLMIFGQGATRCHPHALGVVNAVGNDKVDEFRSELLGWMWHFGKGLLRSTLHFLTRGVLVRVPDVAPKTKTYYRRLGWAASRFALLTDLAMFAIGGRLKIRGKLTGRYADALAWMLMGLSTLRRFEAEGRQADDLPLVQYALEHCLWQTQLAFEGIYRNFDGPIGWWFKTVGLLGLRSNPLGSAPSDSLGHAAARCIEFDNEQFRRLAEGVYLPANADQGLGRLLDAFTKVSKAHAAAERIIRAQRSGILPKDKLPGELADQAMAEGVIAASEAPLLKDALAARMAAIEVDQFAPDDYFIELKTPKNAATKTRRKASLRKPEKDAA